MELKTLFGDHDLAIAAVNVGDCQSLTEWQHAHVDVCTVDVNVVALQCS